LGVLARAALDVDVEAQVWAIKDWVFDFNILLTLF